MVVMKMFVTAVVMYVQVMILAMIHVMIHVIILVMIPEEKIENGEP
ncbi:hypothetical protein GCM10007111_32300 [Virgibacillus kapii]|uniref:Uncharacterized protein n=1 Tax=Virgibacillus kapii TaxID=1638645 RepID=A0ABQ2DU00_9BACI|nr:hypothetical protein [Virgibacillus sp. CM-4]GGJ67989.1 hypothetical protein GCM10007111_32300 [Virgibacillus kapii]